VRASRVKGRKIQRVSATVSVEICSPNEDFGRMNKRRTPDFRMTFQWFVAQIEYLEKSVENPEFFFCYSSKIFVWGAYKSHDDDDSMMCLSDYVEISVQITRR